MRKLTLTVACAILAVSLAACGGSSGGGGGGGGGTTTTAMKGLAACTADATVSVICGTALAPDASTPIVGAEVSLVTSTSESVALTGLYRDINGKLTPSETACLTDATGAFACSTTSAGSLSFQIVGNGFTITFDATGTYAVATEVANTATTAATADSTLKVVVATGFYDSVQNVIKRVFECDTSVTDGDYTGDLTVGNECPMMEIVDGDSMGTTGATNPNTALTTVLGLADGTYPTVAQLFASAEALALFDIVLLNCTDLSGDILTNTTYITNLTTYVENGGNVYASDRSGDYVEQYWPQYIEWYGTTPPDGLTTTKEPINTGQAGGATNQTITVVDPSLLTWMQAEDLVDINNQFEAVFIGGEMIMQEVSTSPLVTELLTATTLTGITGLPISGKTTIPIAVSFPLTSGCVFYTTFHTEAGGTTAQEQYLDYVLLNKISDCQ